MAANYDPESGAPPRLVPTAPDPTGPPRQTAPDAAPDSPDWEPRPVPPGTPRSPLAPRWRGGSAALEPAAPGLWPAPAEVETSADHPCSENSRHAMRSQ